MEISPPSDLAMLTLAPSASSAVTFASRTRRAMRPTRNSSVPASWSSTTSAGRTAMPRPQPPRITMTGTPNHSGKNTPATTTPAAATTADLTWSATGHRQR